MAIIIAINGHYYCQDYCQTLRFVLSCMAITIAIYGNKHWHYGHYYSLSIAMHGNYNCHLWELLLPLLWPLWPLSLPLWPITIASMAISLAISYCHGMAISIGIMALILGIMAIIIPLVLPCMAIIIAT